MDVIEARVRKCINESQLIYKRIRTRTIKFEKYIIPLSDNNPFERDEFVKVLRKKDFDKIGDAIKKVKSDNDQLKKEVKELTLALESQRKYIAALEKESKNKSIKEIIGL